MIANAGNIINLVANAWGRANLKAGDIVRIVGNNFANDNHGRTLTAVAGSAAYLVATGKGTLGWGLVWLLISLASLNFAGWCAGCSPNLWRGMG